MGAAAQFDGIGTVVVAGERAAQGDHADLVAVFLAEQGDGTGVDGVLGRHQLGRDRDVLADDRVDLGLDGGQLVLGHRRVVAEVEAHAVGIDQLTLLGHVRAEHILQRRMHQVGGGVVGAGGQALFGAGAQLGAGADGQGAGFDLDLVGVEVAAGVLLDVQDDAEALLAGRVGPFDLAAIAGLAAAFAVEGGLVEQDLGRLAGLRGVDGFAAARRWPGPRPSPRQRRSR